MKRLVLLFVAFSFALAHAGNNSWSFLGPQGGIINKFAFHPQINSLIYASGWYGTFRSRTSGASWERIPLESYNASTFLTLPKDPNALLAVGASVFRSTNQGSGWEFLSVSPAWDERGDYFWDAAFHSSDPHIIYGVTYLHGVYKSTDGGVTWTQKNTGLNTKPACPSNASGYVICDLPRLMVDPSNGNNVFVLMSSRQVFRSTNGGDSWQSANAGLAFGRDYAVDLAIAPSNPQTLYVGGYRKLYKTTNGGAQWSPTKNTRYLDGIAVDPRNSQTLFIVGSEGGYKSPDGGNTWVKMPLPERSYFGRIAANPKVSQEIIVGGFEQDGIFLSRNNGASFLRSNRGLVGIEIRSLEVNRKKPSQLFAVSSTGNLYISNDSGKQWTPNDDVKTFQGFSARSICANPENATLVAAAINGLGGIAVSHDGARTWQVTGPSTFFPGYDCAFDPKDQNVIYLASNVNGIARSLDGGRSWGIVNAGIADRRIVQVIVSPQNPKTIYALSQGGKVFRSVNGGSNWKATGPGVPGSAAAIVLDPTDPTRMYAAGFLGLYKSTNSGQSWSVKRPFARLFAALDPADSGTIFTGSGGLLEVSNDFGETWSNFPTIGIPGQMFFSALNIPEPNVLYLGANQGLFVYNRTVVNGGPVIQQILPSNGTVGESVSIRGRGFGGSQGGSKVLFGSTDAGAATSWSDTTVSIKVPSGARSGGVKVTVNSRPSNSQDFLVLPPSTTNAVDPQGGASRGGTRVTLLATQSFNSTVFAVIFGKQLATNAVVTPPNIITCLSPPGSGTVDVTIITNGQKYKIGTFTYQ